MKFTRIKVGNYEAENGLTIKRGWAGLWKIFDKDRQLTGGLETLRDAKAWIERRQAHIDSKALTIDELCDAIKAHDEKLSNSQPKKASNRIEITRAEINKWNEMLESSRGTKFYYRFTLWHEGRDEHGKWFDLGNRSGINEHHIDHPSDHYFIKKIKDCTWLYFEDCGGIQERWLLSDNAINYFINKESIDESMEDIAEKYNLTDNYDEATDSIIIPDSYFECVDVFILDLLRNRNDLMMRCAEDENHKKSWHIERASESLPDENKEIIKDEDKDATEINLEALDGTAEAKAKAEAVDELCKALDDEEKLRALKSYRARLSTIQRKEYETRGNTQRCQKIWNEIERMDDLIAELFIKIADKREEA